MRTRSAGVLRAQCVLQITGYLKKIRPNSAPPPTSNVSRSSSTHPAPTGTHIMTRH